MEEAALFTKAVISSVFLPLLETRTISIFSVVDFYILQRHIDDLELLVFNLVLNLNKFVTPHFLNYSIFAWLKQNKTIWQINSCEEKKRKEKLNNSSLIKFAAQKLNI